VLFFSIFSYVFSHVFGLLGGLIDSFDFIFNRALVRKHFVDHFFNLCVRLETLVVLLFDQFKDINALFTSSPEHISQAQTLKGASDDAHSEASVVRAVPLSSRLSQAQVISLTIDLGAVVLEVCGLDAIFEKQKDV
jgi:hypothetical protein